MSPHAGDAPRLRQYTPGIIAGLVFSLGYFLSYFSRTINAVLTPYFQNELQIGVDDLGLLTASYYLSFALLQLPIGALMDRYGPRIVNVGLFSLAVLGALVFYAADNLTGLVIGRALIGAGVAGALMCGFKILRMWVPINLVPSANGIYLLVGSAGAAFAGTPTSLLVESLESWRQVFLIFAGVTVVVMGLMWVLGKENDRDKHLSTASLGQQAKEMGIIFTRFSFWSLVPLFAVAQAISLSVSTLWSHRYLEKVAGVESFHAAAHVSYIAIGAMGGYLLIGNFASFFRVKFGVDEGKFAAGCAGIFMLVQGAVILFPAAHTELMWALYGFIGTGSILCYPALCRQFDESLTGRVNTSINFIVFSGAFFFQWGMGVVIDRLTLPFGESQAYQLCFALVLGIQAVCFIWYLISQRMLRRR